MTDPTVAAVLAGVLGHPMARYTECFDEEADELLDALTAASYAVVKVPEGVAVAHGARLVQAQGKDDFEWFTIEATP